MKTIMISGGGGKLAREISKVSTDRIIRPYKEKWTSVTLMMFLDV